MQVTVAIKGADAIGRALRELPKRIDRKILNDGLLAGALLVRDLARDLAPVLWSVQDPRWTPGALRRAIKAAAVQASRAQYAGEVEVYVGKLSKKQVAAFKHFQASRGAKVNSRLNPSDAFYWRFLEFGTAKMKAANGGRGFLRPAFERRKQQAVDTAMKIFQERVQLEISKLGRSTSF